MKLYLRSLLPISTSERLREKVTRVEAISVDINKIYSADESEGGFVCLVQISPVCLTLSRYGDHMENHHNFLETFNQVSLEVVCLLVDMTILQHVEETRRLLETRVSSIGKSSSLLASAAMKLKEALSAVQAAADSIVDDVSVPNKLVRRFVKL